ncbi:hypothetical protein [Chondromyces apiculatus]|uniref:Uncharacterized protein n=1 Tax=Chondromyces apiculatus DSM 436 TaxID=1192034 RepID=A0A017SY25_9BACT|nr:hypothetical protein [Chondromyces apiculatus]EYF01889.1 Hypothetical protein CAP_7657 [Chondromyces apiculatus DSM 436]
MLTALRSLTANLSALCVAKEEHLGAQRDLAKALAFRHWTSGVASWCGAIDSLLAAFERVQSLGKHDSTRVPSAEPEIGMFAPDEVSALEDGEPLQEVLSRRVAASPGRGLPCLSPEELARVRRGEKLHLIVEDRQAMVASEGGVPHMRARKVRRRGPAACSGPGCYDLFCEGCGRGGK